METTPGKRVQMLREAKGYTSLTSFAEFTKLKVGTLSALEKDKSSPSLETMAKLIEAFPDASLDWLVTGFGTMFKGGQALTPATPAPLPETLVEKPTEPKALALALPTEPVAVLTADEIRDLMTAAPKAAEVRLLESERDSLRRQVQVLLSIVGNRYGLPYPDEAPATAAGGKTEGGEHAAAPAPIGFEYLRPKLVVREAGAVMGVSVRNGEELAEWVDYTERFTTLIAPAGAASGYTPALHA